MDLVTNCCYCKSPRQQRWKIHRRQQWRHEAMMYSMEYGMRCPSTTCIVYEQAVRSLCKKLRERSLKKIYSMRHHMRTWHLRTSASNLPKIRTWPHLRCLDKERHNKTDLKKKCGINWFRSRKIKSRASVERIGGSQVGAQALGSAYSYVVFAQKTTLNSIFGNRKSLN